jgi:hypothetical protein
LSKRRETHRSREVDCEVNAAAWKDT